MAIMWTATLVVLLEIATALEALPVLPVEYLRSVTDYGFASSSKTPSIFDKGGHQTTTIKVKSSSSYHPPKDLLIISPKETGNYPVFLFVHGVACPNYFYSQLLEQIASHGYIVVAPQLFLAFTPFSPFQSQEIEAAVTVANWVPKNLESVLPEGVKGDLNKFVVSGQSTGGKTAFALALGRHKTQLNLKVAALVSIDPVAGIPNYLTTPQILTYEPNSIDLQIPVAIIGTGLGNQSIVPETGPSCAPNELNHVEFYSECRRASHFVLTDYGVNDLLNDNIISDLPYVPIARISCIIGKDDKDSMRRTVAGIITGFLKYNFDQSGSDEYLQILAGNQIAPAKIYPVETKDETA